MWQHTEHSHKVANMSVCSHTEDSPAIQELSVCHTEENTHHWKQFSSALEEYSKATYQTFVKDDSKTVENVNKRRKVPCPADLKYAFRLSCIQDGKKHEQTGKMPTYARVTYAIHL